MRILFLTQFYPPESGAPQNRISDLARRLASWGHGVEVLTALPNYPAGVVFNGYRRRAVLEEKCDEIRVIRTWILASPGKGFIRRLATYWSFVLSSVALGLPKIHRPDVVVVELPPLFLGLSGYLLSRLLRSRLILNVSDLWPASAIAMGVVRNRALIRLSVALEEFLYRKADLITGQTEGIVEDIGTRLPTKEVSLITNGVDMSRFPLTTPSERESAKADFGLADHFVVGYAGLHGHAQGLETLVEAARLITDLPDVVFALVGEGPLKDDLVAAAAGASNVRFLPNLPSSRMPYLLSSFDLAVVPLRRLPLFRGALPSKMFEAMAAGVPIVLSVEGEAQCLVERAGSGICIEPENPKALADAVRSLRGDPEARRRMGEQGRRCVTSFYNRDRIGREFETLLFTTSRGQASGLGPPESKKAGISGRVVPVPPASTDAPREQIKGNPARPISRAHDKTGSS
jgi:glycosyltransferase involved in cell wall biosynthesis